MDFSGLMADLGGCVSDFSRTHGLAASLFLAGLVGSTTHCTTMCSPFVMAQSSEAKRLRETILLPYHLGRITTYTVMAIAFSSILNLAFLFLPVRALVIAPLLMLAGLMFLVSAFPDLSKIFPWLAYIRLSLPYKWISKIMATLPKRQSILRRYLMGIVLGFIPCGLVVSALMAAASAPSPWQAGLAMAAFGLGTIPALLAVSTSGHALKINFPHTMKKISKTVMIFSAIWLFTLAGLMLI